MNRVYLNKEDFRSLINMINMHGIMKIRMQINTIHSSPPQVQYYKYPVLHKFVTRFGPLSGSEIQKIYNNYLQQVRGIAIMNPLSVIRPNPRPIAQNNPSDSVLSLIHANSLAKQFKQMGITNSGKAPIRIPRNQLRTYVANSCNGKNIMQPGNFQMGGTCDDYLVEFADKKELNSTVFGMCNEYMHGGKFSFSGLSKPLGKLGTKINSPENRRKVGKWSKNAVTGFGEGIGATEKKDNGSSSFIGSIASAFGKGTKEVGKFALQTLNAKKEKATKAIEKVEEATVELKTQEKITNEAAKLVEQNCSQAEKQLEEQVEKYKKLQSEVATLTEAANRLYSEAKEYEKGLN